MASLDLSPVLKMTRCVQERELIQKVIANDKQALREFYKTFKPKLERFFKRRIGNPADAEEVVADTLFSAIDSLPLFSGKSKLPTWIMAIAKHELVDYYRRKKIKEIVFSRFPFLEKLISKALGPELVLQEKEAKQKIAATLEGLNEGYQQILRLKYMDGFSMAEIADRLKTTVKAVESKLSRARLAFQKEFGKNKEATPEGIKILNSSLDKRELSF